jgi:hypothetical protein
MTQNIMTSVLAASRPKKYFFCVFHNFRWSSTYLCYIAFENAKKVENRLTLLPMTTLSANINQGVETAAISFNFDYCIYRKIVIEVKKYAAAALFPAYLLILTLI